MTAGDDWEWVYIDLQYDDETFGYSQPMPRIQAKINMERGLSLGRLVDGKRVVRATIVTLDPQPTVMMPVAGVLT